MDSPLKVLSRDLITSEIVIIFIPTTQDLTVFTLLKRAYRPTWNAGATRTPDNLKRGADNTRIHFKGFVKRFTDF